MKLITRDTDYAIRALRSIVKAKKDIVTVSDLTKCIKVPRPFLRKILQILNKAKILKSYKGPKGGFSLALSPKQITLIDLVEIFQGKIELTECTFKKIICPDIKICKVKIKINKIQKYLIAELKGVTLDSIIEKGKKNG